MNTIFQGCRAGSSGSVLPTRDRCFLQDLSVLREAVVSHLQIQCCITQELEALVAAIGSPMVAAVSDGLQSCSSVGEAVVHSTLQLPAQHAVVLEAAHASHVLTSFVPHKARTVRSCDRNCNKNGLPY